MTENKTLRPILEAHPFFKGLDQPYLDLIVGCAANVMLREGEIIFREGEEATHFYVIRHGMVALELYSPSEGELTIQTLGEGEIVGWSWLVPPYLWHVTARAIQDTRAIRLDGTCLRGKCEADPALGYEFLKRLTPVLEERLKSAQLQLLDVYCP